MIGYLFTDRERRELEYVLRKELDEMVMDLNDARIDPDIKRAIETRYKVIFGMYARSASSKDKAKYTRR
jgi:hypothetical protein